MKKLSILAASVLAAALFFGCSNSSDSPILPSGGSGSSSSSGLPKSVGTNPFKGKKLYRDSKHYKEFGDSTYVEKKTISCVEDVGVSAACDIVTELTYSYSYNTETKRIYSLLKGSKTTIVRNETSVNYPDLDDYTFNDDAGFLTAMAKVLKPLDNQLTTEDELKDKAKTYRYSAFRDYGYDDATSTRYVNDDEIKRYNEMRDRRAKALITAESYDDSNPGSIKFQSDTEYLPKNGVKTLADAYNNYSIACDFKSGDEIIVDACCYSSNIYKQADIIYSTTAYIVSGYVCSSISGNTVKISKNGALIDPSSLWFYGDVPAEAASFKGKAEDVGDTRVVTLSFKYMGQEMDVGQVIIKYATYENRGTSGVQWFEYPDD